MYSVKYVFTEVLGVLVQVTLPKKQLHAQKQQ